MQILHPIARVTFDSPRLLEPMHNISIPLVRALRIAPGNVPCTYDTMMSSTAHTGRDLRTSAVGTRDPAHTPLLIAEGREGGDRGIE